jgi:hypothetical protein
MVTPLRSCLTLFAHGLLLAMAAQTSGELAVRRPRLLDYRMVGILDTKLMATCRHGSYLGISCRRRRYGTTGENDPTRTSTALAESRLVAK